MNLHKYIPTHLTLFLIIGIIVGNAFSFPVEYLFGSLLLVSLLLFFFKRKASKSFYPTYTFTVVSWLLCFVVGITTISLQKPENKKAHYSHFLAEKPQKITLEVTDILKSSKKYHKAYAKLLSVDNKQTKGRVIVNIPKKDSITIGQQLLAKSEIVPIFSPKNPYQFDYKKYLQYNDIYHQLFLKEHFYKTLKINDNIFYYLAKWRQKITSYFSENGMQKENLSIVKALLLGRRQSISKELKQSYSDAGVIHILAISGLHIGIIWLILSFLFRPLRQFKYGKLLSTSLIILLLWGYAVFVGMSDSVVRAVTMFTAISVGKSLNRPIKTVYSLLLSLFLLLLLHPKFLFSVGFQLSYLAVFGILWLQPKLSSLWQPRFKLVNYFWQLMTVSVSAQIGVLPLSLHYFHQFPSLFFISNLVIIPFLGFLLGMGFLLVLLITFNLSLPIFIEWYDIIIGIMNFFVKKTASQEEFLFQNISISLLSVFLLYGIVFFFFYWTEKKHFYRFIALLISVICLQGWFVFEKNRTENKKEFIVFQQYKGSAKAFRKGNTLTCYANDSVLSYSTIQNYALGERISTITYEKTPKYFTFSSDKILIIDSLGLYQYKNIQPNIIVLQQSPKIHLNRLIEKWKPKLIIADGSNYYSFINRWKATCQKTKTPFYDVSQKGAFVLSLKD
ncbi:MAG: ComEC family competence protein [Flavobacteriaceae bacterium]|nr:ComEC family competence protein [Flavobacteriaceae bacterium]